MNYLIEIAKISGLRHKGNCHIIRQWPVHPEMRYCLYEGKAIGFQVNGGRGIMIDHMFAFSWTAPPFLDGSAITYWSICALAVLLMAIAKSGFGGAIASLSAPLMLTILPARETLAILLPLYMVTDIWAILIWRGYCYWRILFWMVLFAIIGASAGLFANQYDK
jgi:hypothetical protein